jgi:hypothetical protein
VANPNKAKGTAWESAVRDFLNLRLGLYWVGEERKFKDLLDPMNVKRQAQEGAKDIGDLHAHPFIIECKDVKAPAVPAWLRQANVEARNAHFPYGVAVHKVRGANVARGRVHFDVRTWTRVRLQLGLSAREFYAAYGFTHSFRSLISGRWYLTTDLESFARLLTAIRRAQ